jgi:Flp pilus assembly protein TadG
MRQIRSARGQAMVEFAMVIPLILMLLLGVIEGGYALLDQHVVTKLSREGANLISRDTSLQDALSAMKTMTTSPVNFDASSRVIFSVIMKGQTVGTANYNKDFLYQRYSYGAIAGASKVTTVGSGSFGPAPEYQAVNADSDANLRVTNMPVTIAAPGGMIYITEIYSTHKVITPFDKLGVTMPRTLYSIAYF